MKKLLPAILLFLLAFSSCKKEKSPAMGTTTPIIVTVAGISPATVSAGTVVTLTGTNFGTDITSVKVLFNGVAGTVQSVSNTEIKTVVPVTTSGNVTVYVGNQVSTGAAFIYTTYTIPLVTATGLSPASGTSGTVVTLTGTNFGTDITNVKVLFNGVAGTVQSVTATEIKVVAPATTSGNVTLTIGNETIIGPAFTYDITPYVNGDVTLKTQAEVDAFVAVNKGRQLQITGSLSLGELTDKGSDITSVSGLSNITSVSGSVAFYGTKMLAEALFLNTITTVGSISINKAGFTTLSFNNLKAFSGSISLLSLSNLTHISFNGLKTVQYLGISSCPLLTDVSFLDNVTSASSIYLYGLGVTRILMDNLSGTITGLNISNCSNLSQVSFKALAGITGLLTLYICDQLSSINFNSLSSVSGKLGILWNQNLTDLSGFGSLQTLGSLSIYNSTGLTSLHGLEQLTTLTSPAIAGGTGASELSRINGIYIDGSTKLTSLSGLQNVTSVPIIYITGSPLLNNFCPLKAPIIKLSTSVAYTYNFRNRIDQIQTVSMPALTLTKNGNYATTPDALAAVALCQ